jgi:hypothetical protein
MIEPPGKERARRMNFEKQVISMMLHRFLFLELIN